MDELGSRSIFSKRPRRRLAVATTLTVAASLLVAVPITQAVADPDAQAAAKGPAVTTFPRPEDPDAALRAAVEEAKKQNKPVAVQAAYTETSRTWAYPDGHLATESYAGPAQLRQGDGSWAWIDTSLVEQNGVLKPKLAKANVRLSAGGSDPFATMTLGREKTFGLSWPSELPRPQIKGNVATYPGVAGPSGDLVVTALPTGFRHDIVLRERPTGPVEFRIPVQAKGVTLKKTKSGGLSLAGAKDKKEVASAPAPLMWDAAAEKPSADRPGRQAKVNTTVEGKDGATALLLKPDADLAGRSRHPVPGHDRSDYDARGDPRGLHQSTELPVVTGAGRQIRGVHSEVWDGRHRGLRDPAHSFADGVRHGADHRQAGGQGRPCSCG